MTTDKKTRTPRNSETITKGALALTLAEQVELRNTLNKSIETQVQAAKDAAAEAVKIAGV